MCIAKRQLLALAELGQLLDSRGFDYWLFGGWAVDFYVGAVTRDHGDIDLAVWVDDVGEIDAALVAVGWRHTPADGEDGGTRYERQGVRAELTYIVKGDGGEVFIPFRKGNVLWSREPFGSDVRELRGGARSCHPPGTSEARQVDAEGRRGRSCDRSGRSRRAGAACSLTLVPSDIFERSRSRGRCPQAVTVLPFE